MIDSSGPTLIGGVLFPKLLLDCVFITKVYGKVLERVRNINQANNGSDRRIQGTKLIILIRIKSFSLKLTKL